MEPITNTKDAAMLASALNKEGKSNKLIAKELARRGWISRRTGKRLTTAGVWNLIYRARSGDKFENQRGIEKHAKKAKLYAPKRPKPAFTLAEPTTRAVGIEALREDPWVPVPHFENCMKDLQAFSKTLRGLAVSIDTLLEAVK